MDIYLYGLLWVAGAAALAAVITLLIHKIRSTEDRVDNNTASGLVFTIIGGLNAVLVAFVLISLFDAASTTRAASYREANGLVAVSWAAKSLPDPAKARIQELAVSYSATVTEHEWPQMREGATVDGPGWHELEELRVAIAAAETTPNDEWQDSRKIEAATQLWEVYQARQVRLAAAADNGVSAVVWFALLLGSVMSMGLTWLLGGPKPISHAIIAGTLAAGIALLLYAIHQMQNPFSGGAMVEPEAFRSLLDRLR